MDLDLPFSLSYSVGATINLYSTLADLAVFTWQVLIVAIPMVYVATQMQVRNRFIFELYCNGEIILGKPSNEPYRTN
jgi:hypothetical protein